MKKNIIGFLICITLIFSAALSFCGYAQETEIKEEETESPIIEEGVFKQWLSEWQTEYEQEQAEAEEPTTFAEWCIKKAKDEFPEIAAALSTLFSIILLIAQNILKKNNSTFTKNTAKVLSDFTNATSEQIEKACDNAEKAYEKTNEYAEAIASIKEEQIKLEAERKALASSMRIQSEMLNIVIQSSNLTQWKKEQIGALYTEAQKKISELEGGESV